MKRTPTIILALLLTFSTLSQAWAQFSTPNKVDGITVPAEIKVDPAEGYTVITPTLDEGVNLKTIKWLVVAVGERSIKNTEFGNDLVVAAPAKGQQVFIYAAALLQKEGGEPWLTDHVRCVVVGQAANGLPPVGDNGGTDVTPPATFARIPADVKGLNVVMVFDINSADRSVADITQSERVKSVLAENESFFYAYDVNDPTLVRTKIKPLIDRVGTPALVVISDGGKKVLPNNQAQKLNFTDDAAANETILLDLIGKSAGGN